MIIGQIKEVTLADDLIDSDGFIEISNAGTITNSGLDAYYETRKIGRLSYAGPDKPIKEIN